MQILLRKYPLSAGQLLAGNQDGTSISLTLYRHKMGIIPQQVKVFNGTLAENIILGRSRADSEKFKELLSYCNFADYIGKFEHGLMTMLGENGRHLSGGELQMLGLARALLDEPDILLIDEGLNALDAQLEKKIFEMLQQYAGEHIVLISTHNLNIIRQVDYVYVLDQGRILQSGTPADLLMQQGYFRNVWQNWNHNASRTPCTVQIK
jgi:ATP-binding cassette subfamily B protein